MELVRWETHAYPGISDDAQEVINQQIPTDYDLFIGVMWCRYGTPTGRAGSGTVEEFNRAKSRYDQDSTSVQLMIYFKDAPIPPGQIDPEQLTKVTAFRESLGSEGALYWPFTNTEEFEKLLRLHVTRRVQQWHRDMMTQPSNRDTSIKDDQFFEPATIVDKDEEEDLGVLDLNEIYEEKFEELSDIVLRIAVSTNELVEQVSAHTQEINDRVERSQGNVNRSTAKRLVGKVAEDMDRYVVRMEEELPIFEQNLNEGMDAFIRTTTMVFETSVAESDQN